MGEQTSNGKKEKTEAFVGTFRVQQLIDAGVLAVGDGYRAKNVELASHGIPFARAGNIDGGFLFNDADRFPEADLHKVGDKISRPGDVVFTSKGTVGRFAYVLGSTPRFVFAPQLCYWRSLDPNVIDSRFLLYWMHGAEFWEQADSVKGQTDMADYVSLTDQRRMWITLPPLPEQRAIARVLGSLDDKIELNRRMNRTLEDLARGLFRSWFVDFDPVVKPSKGLAGPSKGFAGSGSPKAASGGGSAPLASPSARAASPSAGAAPADLFPTRLVDSPLGPIPEGWRVGTVADLCMTQYGYTASATDEAIGPRMLRVTDMNKEPWVEWADVPHCQIDDDLLPRYALKLGDVLVSRMADPGKAAIVEEVLPEGAVFASYLIRLATRSIAASYYLFYYLRSDQYLDYAESVSGGTVQKNMNAQVITAAQMVIAPDAIADEFARIVRPWRAQIAANLQESRSLAALRDALLPQLLSGEIRLREAERAVEGALQATRPPPRAGGPITPRGGKAAAGAKGKA